MNNNQTIAADLPGDNVALPSGATTGEIVTLTKLHEAGAYFGHKKSTWNPKMKPYISSIKKGVHIIDTVKTKRAIEFAYSIIKKFAEREATFIFVGTRKQSQATIRENALRTNSFYVSERWLGGTLTNNRTIFNSVKRLFELEKLAESNFADYTKKEGVNFSKHLAKLQRNLAGIKNMRSKPQVMIVADPRVDEIAVKEARKLGVKVIGIVDTNADPNMVDIAIPANDDSIKSVTLIITILADAIAAAKGGRQLFAFQPDDKITLPEELKSERPPRPEGRFGNRPRFGDANRTRTFGATSGVGATSAGARTPREGEAARTFTPRRFDSPAAAAPRTISANVVESTTAATPAHVKHEAQPKVERAHKVEAVTKPATHEVAKPAHATDKAHKSEVAPHSKDHASKDDHAPKAVTKIDAKKPIKGDSSHDKK